MNYLAHLYFADETPESRVGNLMPDFMKGPVEAQPYGPAVKRGMHTHCEVDRFTDSHEIFACSKALISPARRRFAGIIVDVCYDHFLTQHWTRFSETPLPEFTDQVYRSFEAYTGDAPPLLQRVMRLMAEHDWLQGYAETAGVGRALDGLSGRIKRTNTLRGAVEELDSQYDAMEQHFLDFFPDLIRHMEEHPS